MNFLNLRTFIFILITGLILSSCNKDKDATTDNIIIGTWTAGIPTFTVMIGEKTLEQYFTEVLGLSTVEAQALSDYYTQMITEDFEVTGDEIQIKSDNTYTANLGGYPDSGTWSLSADGKKLTIDSSTDSDGPVIFDVIELTSNKLKIRMEISISEDIGGDETPELINLIVVYNFTK